MNMVSRGSNGFLGAAYGPDTTVNGNRLAIGLVELPGAYINSRCS